MELDLWFIAFIFSGPFPPYLFLSSLCPPYQECPVSYPMPGRALSPPRSLLWPPQGIASTFSKILQHWSLLTYLALDLLFFFLWAIWELSGWRPRLVFFWVPQWLNLFSINVSSLLMANPLKICESNFGGGQRDSMKKYVESFYKSMMLLLLYLYKNKKYHEYYNGTLLPLLLLALILLLLISNKILQVKHNGLSRIFQWICGTRGLLNGGGESRKRGEVWKGRRKVKGVGLME